MTDLLCTICNPPPTTDGTYIIDVYCHPCLLAESNGDDHRGYPTADEVASHVIPHRYRTAVDVPATLAEHDPSRVGLVLRGEPGHGKTRAMCALIRRDIHYAFQLGERGERWQWWDATTLINRLRGGQRDGESERITRLCINARILLLDDLGAETPTEYAAGRIREIVGERYNRMSPTLVTTNRPWSEGDAERRGKSIEGMFGVPVATRLWEAPARVMEWADVNHRLKRRVPDSEVQTTMTGAEA